MDILLIDGVALPAPNEYKVQLSDLDSSDTGRTEDGGEGELKSRIEKKPGAGTQDQNAGQSERT